MSAEETNTKATDDPVEGSRMSLGAHLDELRSRLVRAGLGLTLAFVACWVFHQEIAEIVLQPLERTVSWLNEDLVELYETRLAEDPTLLREEYFRQVGEGWVLADPIPLQPRADAASSGIFFYLKICFYFAFFIAGPFVLWELWQFIAAGLYSSEKKVIHRVFPFSTLLFFVGVLFGYFMMLPYGYYFLFGYGLEQTRPDPKLEEYLSFVTNLTLALGIVFQLPLVMMVLSRVGMVEPSDYSKHRGMFWISSLVIAAVLTPPDPFTQMMMAIPMAVLYEFGYLLARIAHRKALRAEADEL
jgi:sec-independent protein translocase protein TatC